MNRPADPRTALKIAGFFAFLWLMVPFGRELAAQRPRVYRDRIDPHWFADDTRFWYRVELSRGRSEFVLVDTESGTRRPAFDHQRLADALKGELNGRVSQDRLPVTSIEYDAEMTSVSVTGPEGTWTVDLNSYVVDRTGERRRPAPRKRFFMPPKNSQDRGGDVELSVDNRLDTDIELIWIDRSGKPQSYGGIPKGTVKKQHTFVGHIWLLQTTDGKPLAAFESFEGPNEIVVSEETLAATVQGNRRPPRTERDAKPRPTGARSPDGQTTAFARDDNLWLKYGDDTEVQLTTDGHAQESFRKDASRARLVSMRYNAQDPPPDAVDVRWSPDGKFLLAFQTRKVAERRVHYVESSPRDQLQPKLHSYPYAKPGDDLPVSRPRLFSVADKKEVPVALELMPNPFELRFLRWSEDSSRCWLLYNERGHQNLRVLEVSAADGNIRSVISEHSDTFIHYSGRGKFVLEWLPDDRLLWASERTGWNHLYLYDTREGGLLNAVTKGDWNVRRIEHIDRESGVIWFYAVGIRKGQDPYHQHFCRINFDGSGFQQLTEGDGTHEVRFSEDRQFLFDKYSRVDLPPVTELRRADDGSLVCVLEKADASEVTSRRRLPIRFSAAGRDSTTDIWGIIHLPLNYTPDRQYPVVEYIYAGPHDHHVPKSFRTGYRLQSVADRGMIVVQIDGMGTAWRSKKFHDVCYRNLRDAGFPDRIAWMKAAAEKYPSMDLSRVGIYGGSAGGQNAMAALLWHGTFYKVAVADCGCHDNRMDKLWWNEQWMGYPADDFYAASSNAENAYRLQGKLLLVVGELDRNVDPASTMQVVDRLIRADKDFDFLIIPGAGHGAAETPYGSRRRAAFLAEHLGANRTPSMDFRPPRESSERVSP